jgi:hypothetical protein
MLHRATKTRWSSSCNSLGAPTQEACSGHIAAITWNAARLPRTMPRTPAYPARFASLRPVSICFRRDVQSIRRDSARLNAPRETAASVRPDSCRMVLLKIGIAAGMHLSIVLRWAWARADDVRASYGRGSRHRHAARAQPAATLPRLRKMTI